MKNINIGMEEAARQTSVNSLAQYLADSMVLKVTLQGFHWNVESTDFGPLHEAFQEQYEDIEAANDETAERIKFMGGYAPASLTGYVEKAELVNPDTDMSDRAMIERLVEDHEYMCRLLRSEIAKVQEGGDEGTADYYIERLQKHEKTAWFMRSHLV